MKSISFLIDKQFLKLNIIPFVLTILFVILTLIIVSIVIHKELKKVGCSGEQYK